MKLTMARKKKKKQQETNLRHFLILKLSTARFWLWKRVKRL
jgi:hypothetical protein